MPTTYPLNSLAVRITSAGIEAPSYSDILLSLQASFRLIYGEDTYLEPDSQDGELLALFAKAIHDCNQASISVYLSYSPSTALGEGLSSIVKTNGLRRNVSSRSQVTVTLAGTAGATVTNGQVEDVSGNVWNLPSSVVIGAGGTTSVTATAVNLGSIRAQPGEVNKIRTPTFGWTSVTNAGSASIGEPVEKDVALRARQKSSVALPSSAILSGIVSALEALDGVTEVVGIENDADVDDVVTGLPPHSICLIVDGGDVAEIAQAINVKKTPGTKTFGNTSSVIVGTSGISKTIYFSRPEDVSIRVRFTVRPLAGFTSAIGEQARQAVLSYVNALKTGKDLIVNRLYLPAQLNGADNASTYELEDLEVALGLASFGTVDLPMLADQRARLLSIDDVELTVL